MLNWSVTLFVIALMAAILGVGGVTGPASDIAMVSGTTGTVLLVFGFLARTLTNSGGALP